jgi:hypothetical protein
MSITFTSLSYNDEKLIDDKIQKILTLSGYEETKLETIFNELNLPWVRKVKEEVKKFSNVNYLKQDTIGSIQESIYSRKTTNTANHNALR